MYTEHKKQNIHRNNTFSYIGYHSNEKMVGDSAQKLKLFNTTQSVVVVTNIPQVLTSAIYLFFFLFNLHSFTQIHIYIHTHVNT